MPPKQYFCNCYEHRGAEVQRRTYYRHLAERKQYYCDCIPNVSIQSLLQSNLNVRDEQYFSIVEGQNDNAIGEMSSSQNDDIHVGQDQLYDERDIINFQSILEDIQEGSNDFTGDLQDHSSTRILIKLVELKIRHRLTDAALNDLIKVIKLIDLSHNFIPKYVKNTETLFEAFGWDKKHTNWKCMLTCKQRCSLSTKKIMPPIAYTECSTCTGRNEELMKKADTKNIQLTKKRKPTNNDTSDSEQESRLKKVDAQQLQYDLLETTKNVHYWYKNIQTVITELLCIESLLSLLVNYIPGEHYNEDGTMH